MSIGVVLTIIFVVLQLTHVIDWAWWQIVLPALVEVAFDLALVFGLGSLAVKWMND